jgi:hypothetical protein
VHVPAGLVEYSIKPCRRLWVHDHRSFQSRQEGQRTVVLPTEGPTCAPTGPPDTVGVISHRAVSGNSIPGSHVIVRPARTQEQGPRWSRSCRHPFPRQSAYFGTSEEKSPQVVDEEQVDSGNRVQSLRSCSNKAGFACGPTVGLRPQRSRGRRPLRRNELRSSGRPAVTQIDTCW